MLLEDAAEQFLTWMMVSEIEHPHAKNTHTHRRADSDSRLFVDFRERTIIGPILQVHIVKFLGQYGIDIQIPSTSMKERKCWVVICRGKNRFVEESPHFEPGDPH